MNAILKRNFASWRLMADINETDDTHSRSIWEGVKLCLTDYRLYLFVLTQHLSILSQTFQYFFPSIVQTLGFGKIETLLLTVPGEPPSTLPPLCCFVFRDLLLT